MRQGDSSEIFSRPCVIASIEWLAVRESRRAGTPRERFDMVLASWAYPDAYGVMLVAEN